MKKIRAPFFVLVALLSSCASVQGNTLTLYGYALSHNGELASLDASSATYTDTTYLEEDATNLTSLFEEGFSGLFFFTQIGCSHCLEFEKPFCQFVINHTLLVHRFYNDKTNYAAYMKNAAVFNDYYGVTTFDGATPALYMGKKGSFVAWTKGATSLSVLENIYSTQVENKSGLTYFTTEAAFALQKKENPTIPVYFFDSTVTENDAFYQANLLALGQNSKKTFYAIDLARVKEEEKAAFYKDFSLLSYESLLVTPTVTYHLLDKNDSEAAHQYLLSFWA